MEERPTPGERAWSFRVASSRGLNFVLTWKFGWVENWGILADLKGARPRAQSSSTKSFAHEGSGLKFHYRRKDQR